MTSKRARFVTYGEQVDLVRNAPRAAALGMRTVPGTWQSHPVVRSQRAGMEFPECREAGTRFTIAKLDLLGVSFV